MTDHHDDALPSRFAAYDLPATWDLDQQLDMLADNRARHQRSPRTALVQAQADTDAAFLMQRFEAAFGGRPVGVGEAMVWATSQLGSLLIHGVDPAEMLLVFGEFAGRLWEAEPEYQRFISDDIDLDAIRARHAAASRGPHSFTSSAVISPVGDSDGGPAPIAYVVPPPPGGDDERRDQVATANRAFFAHAWGDIRDLIETLDSIAADLQDAMDRTHHIR
ncbi:hypothetical protein [Actinomadura flavalba]|uniref:hypothetical protein n=1 Tax=Actinomadura flavalba TaxID=1120938 RepID=UPI00036F03C2|nr:hypothetical protein [Actinomadura flavalba]